MAKAPPKAPFQLGPIYGASSGDDDEAGSKGGSGRDAAGAAGALRVGGSKQDKEPETTEAGQAGPAGELPVDDETASVDAKAGLRRRVPCSAHHQCPFLAVGVPGVLWGLDFRAALSDSNFRYAGWFISGLFVFLALPISVYEVVQHMESFSKPHLQRHIIRVLWMVPIYAIDSWLALRFHSAAIYLDTVRECYEAYVIYNFYMYLLAWLEERGNLESLAAEKPPMRHLFPFSYCVRPWTMGGPFLRNCRAGVLNYVVLRPLTTLVALLAEWRGVYGNGQLFNLGVAYPWCALLNNFSQAWALYCLVLFYVAMHDDLAPMQPFLKFACVKAVVFFSFWQAIAFSALQLLGLLPDWLLAYATYDPQAGAAASLQEFCICIEMFFAAIAHAYAFSPREFRDPSLPSRPPWRNLWDMLDVSDVLSNVQRHTRAVGGRVARGVASRGAAVGQAVLAAAQGRPPDSSLLKSALLGSPGTGRGRPLLSEEDQEAEAASMAGGGDLWVLEDEEASATLLPYGPNSSTVRTGANSGGGFGGGGVAPGREGPGRYQPPVQLDKLG